MHIQQLKKQTSRVLYRNTVGLVTLCCGVMTALAQSPAGEAERLSYSPYAEQAYPMNVYFGDTHLHSNLSMDAYNSGNINIGPAEAYRFAKGEALEGGNGWPVQLRRPLDFLVVSDHASNMGVMVSLERPDSPLLNTEKGKQWRDKITLLHETAKTNRAKAIQLSDEIAYLEGFKNGAIGNATFRRSVWQQVVAAADAYNDPGTFTALIGYEWTQTFYNLHRVVIFKDNAAKAGQIVPFSQYDSSDPEDLWAFLAAYEANSGGEVLAIPHNGNLSSGVMFALEDAKGKPLSADYAKTRSRWEPLVEVTQIKGDSEAHLSLSQEDTFAEYETYSNDVPPWDIIKKERQLTTYDSWFNKHDKEPAARWMRPYEYARSALKLGIGQQAQLGVNPFKFGMIGSTDSHSGLATADESNFWGKWTESGPHKDRVLGPWRPSSGAEKFWPGWRMVSSGYAAIWAEENTREALFAAMKRKETYATTGPRMTVRFFGGWGYEKEDALKPDLARIGYSKGVPMGGDLTSAPKGQSPNFLILAVKDPKGANLDRVQVIKGWHDKNGELHEKIYNVALSDNRKENWRGQVKPVGSTVNVKDASYTNTIGDPELAVVWTDPDFNKDELAFYYVRVLEIPTPRWTAYDAKFFGLKDIPKEVPMITQERAYTSPIWYSPE